MTAYITPGQAAPPPPAPRTDSYRPPSGPLPQTDQLPHSTEAPATKAIAASPTPTNAAMLSNWIAACCHLDPASYSTLLELYPSWTQWVETRGERPGSAKALARALDAHPELKRHNQAGTNRTGWQGLTVRREDSQAVRL